MAPRGYSMRLRDVRLHALAVPVAGIERRHAPQVLGEGGQVGAARAVPLAYLAGGARDRAADAVHADPAQAHGAGVRARPPILHLAGAGAVAGDAPGAAGAGALRDRDACSAVAVARLAHAAGGGAAH